MTREELVKRLRDISKLGHGASGSVREVRAAVSSLIEDIELDGVLDVQAPLEVSETMNLPRVDVTNAKRVRMMRRALSENGITRQDLSGCTIADIITLYDSMPKPD